MLKTQNTMTIPRRRTNFGIVAGSNSMFHAKLASSATCNEINSSLLQLHRNKTISSTVSNINNDIYTMVFASNKQVQSSNRVKTSRTYAKKIRTVRRFYKQCSFFPRILWLLATIAVTAVCALPKAIDLMSSSILAAHEPNYCNRSATATTAGLLRSPLGQFLGFPCSNEFFHCRWQSDGYRTYKKNCRPGLVYDTLGTQNCNYDYNVKGCAISSDPAKCKDKEFMCPLSESCVSMAHRCDGKYECVLEEDEQNCPICKPSEFPCVVSEQCIPMSGRCNGVQECQDGTDEQDCDDCGQNKFLCRKSGKCIVAKLRCDGVVQCPHGEDEMLCKKASINAPFLRMYVCENRRAQVPRNTVCDGIANCPDASDEKYCNVEELTTTTVLYNNELALSYDSINSTMTAGGVESVTSTGPVDVDDGSSTNLVSGIVVGAERELLETTQSLKDDVNNTIAYSEQGVTEETVVKRQQPDKLFFDSEDKIEGDFEPLNTDPNVEAKKIKNTNSSVSEDVIRYSSLKGQNTNNDIVSPSPMNMSKPMSSTREPETTLSKQRDTEHKSEEVNQLNSSTVMIDFVTTLEVNQSESDPATTVQPTTVIIASTTLNETGSDVHVPVVAWKDDPLANPWQTEKATTSTKAPAAETDTTNIVTMTSVTPLHEENIRKIKRRIVEIKKGEQNQHETSQLRQECRHGESHGECKPRVDNSLHGAETVEREIPQRFTTKNTLEKNETITSAKNGTYAQNVNQLTTGPSDPAGIDEAMLGKSPPTPPLIAPPKKYRHISAGRIQRVKGRQASRSVRPQKSTSAAPLPSVNES